MRRRHRRNAPMSRVEKAALLRVLMKHNPRRRRVRKLTKAQRRLIALRNLRKAHRARSGRRVRSLRSHRGLRRWASSQIGKHQTGARGYVIVNRYGIRRRRGRKIRLPGLPWSGKKGTVTFRGRHHDPDFYNGSYEEFDTMFTNPRRVTTAGGKRFVVITNKNGRRVAKFRIKRTRKGRTPARLRKFQFKAGTARLARALRKARPAWRRWRAKQLAAKRRAGRVVRRVRRARRVVRRVRRTVRRARRVVRHHRRARRTVRRVHHRRRKFVFTAARRRALAKARRARR